MENKTNSNNSMGKVQISVRQFMLLIITFVISTADVFVPAFVAQEAKQDAWISVILGTLGGLVTINIAITLALRYPNKTIIQYSCDILGKPLGTLIGVSYTYFFLRVAWSVTRQLEEIFVIAFNPEIPYYVFGILTIIVAIYAVFSGLEVIARINEILLPWGMGILLFIAFINIPNIDLNKLLPVFYNGYVPSLKGAFFIHTWMSEAVLFLQIIPYVKEKQKIRRAMNISIIVLGFSLMIGIMTITVFGAALTAKLLLPALEYVRYAKLGYYIQNLDISIMIVWTSGIFVKIALAYFAGTLALSQLLGLKSYKNIIIPVGAMLIIFSLVSGKTLTDVLFFLKYILPFFFLFIALILPLLLLTVSLIRKNNSK